MLSLIENFADATLLPLFYYVLAGLPDLILFKSIDLADSMFGNFKSINQTLTPCVCKLDNLLGATLVLGTVSSSALLINYSKLRSVELKWCN